MGIKNRRKCGNPVTGHLNASANLAILFFVSCIVTTPVNAEMYRCQQPNGTPSYQDTPCASGPQKKIDSPTSGYSSDPNDEIAAAIRRRERQLADAQREMKSQEVKNKEDAKRYEAELPQRRAESAKRAADAIAKFSKDEAQQITDLRKCVRRDQSVNCSPIGYRRMLRALHRSDVEDVLGSAQTQLLGGQELLYFSAPISEGSSWRAGRLQLKLGYDSALPSGIRGATNRVIEVNVY